MKECISSRSALNRTPVHALRSYNREIFSHNISYRLYPYRRLLLLLRHIEGSRTNSDAGNWQRYRDISQGWITVEGVRLPLSFSQRTGGRGFRNRRDRRHGDWKGITI